MNFSGLLAGLLLSLVLVAPGSSWAAHPLITDDAGTQGKGKFQLELNGQYDSDKETVDGVNVKITGGQASATLSYGIIDNIDLVLTVPYQWGKIAEDNITVYDETGISDTVMEAKWRFLEKDGFSLALKPGFRIPSGDYKKGQGAGEIGYQAFLIGSKEIADWAFHVNLGYVRNENKVDERINIWHASLAATWETIKNLKLVANVGIERNPSDNAVNDPAFLIGGLIYSLTENIDLDCGVKYGLNSSETDYSLLAGITLRF
ncbi:MAG: transporter [Deltaproteobacteria bacterium HGW-Deltaproteobacteria-12]|jgi:hypothetical protein|nr:MAG: transporter [Deltaproteobacteria bacterium HGW-Deltaproteobacteria-12]